MGKKQLGVVIKAIQEAKEITPKGQLVKVYLPNVLKHSQLRLQELKDILQLLEDDKKILTLMRFPNYLLKLPPGYVYTDMLTGEKVSPSTEHFTVEVSKKFDKWCAEYWAKREASESLLPVPADKEATKTETTYRITFTKGREILLNDSYQIATPDFDRENEQVFSYLYNHPNEKFTKKQLERELRVNLVKSFHKIVENLGFTRALRKAFFSVSQDSIEFRRLIESKDLTPSVVKELKSLIAKD